MLTSNSNSGSGKCTVEVVIDGAADIEISGDSAVIRNQSGQQPQWRRFVCSERMPTNPANFRFSGVDGRGRQQLIRDPQNGGPAIVRIEDRDGGAEGYTFDLTWSAGSPGGYAPTFDNGRLPSRQENTGFGAPRGNRNQRCGAEQAVRACEDAVGGQAAQRFNGAKLEFRSTALDDQPGRNDWIVGAFDVRRPGRADGYRFSCLVDFDNGQIRSAEIEPLQNDRGPGNGAADFSQRAACERAVSERLQREGYGRADIESIHDGPGRGRTDWIAGTVRANRGNRPDVFNFSCSFDRGHVAVRSIDLKRR